MAKISAEGKVPKRLGNCVVYPLDGNMILRKISGFSSIGMLKDSRYERSRQNASEFGRVSALCKKIRVVLKDILPKKNNLAVCNSFIK